MNPFNSPWNKLTFSGLVLGGAKLINERLPPELALSADDLYWVVAVVTLIVLYKVPNLPARIRAARDSQEPQTFDWPSSIEGVGNTQDPKPERRES